MNAKRKILEKIVRVDQAGEVGAQQIYEGQKLVFKTLKNKKDFDQISRMAGEEKRHRRGVGPRRRTSCPARRGPRPPCGITRRSGETAARRPRS